MHVLERWGLCGSQLSSVQAQGLRIARAALTVRRISWQPKHGITIPGHKAKRTLRAVPCISVWSVIRSVARGSFTSFFLGIAVSQCKTTDRREKG